MTREFTLEELAKAVQDWCAEHQLLPANGQAAEQITERNVRYYRTIGLLDAPLGNYTKRFTNKHRLQLIAIRSFQAQGLPLRRIRDELYGKSIEDLSALEKQVSQRGQSALFPSALLQMPLANESWSVVPLADEFLLVSRRNKAVPRAIVEKINQLLSSVGTEGEHETKTKGN